jgi:hypothetical protein
MATLLREIVLDPMPSASVRSAELGAARQIRPALDTWFAQAVDRDPRKRHSNATLAFEGLTRALRAPDVALGPSSPGPPVEREATKGHTAIAPVRPQRGIAVAQARDDAQITATFAPAARTLAEASAGGAPVSPRKSRALLWSALVLGGGVVIAGTSWAVSRASGRLTGNSRPTTASVESPASRETSRPADVVTLAPPESPVVAAPLASPSASSLTPTTAVGAAVRRGGPAAHPATAPTPAPTPRAAPDTPHVSPSPGTGSPCGCAPDDLQCLSHC